MADTSPDYLTPRLAFACALVYCAGVNRELSKEEKSYLGIALTGPVTSDDYTKRAEAALEALSAALDYCRRTPVHAFLAAATPVLNKNQKLTILLNLVDLALADGEADADEAAFVSVCQQAFGIDKAEFHAMAAPILLKNDRQQFGN